MDRDPEAARLFPPNESAARGMHVAGRSAARGRIASRPHTLPARISQSPGFPLGVVYQARIVRAVSARTLPHNRTWVFILRRAHTAPSAAGSCSRRQTIA